MSECPHLQAAQEARRALTARAGDRGAPTLREALDRCQWALRREPPCEPLSLLARGLEILIRAEELEAEYGAGTVRSRGKCLVAELRLLSLGLAQQAEALR